MRLSSPVRSSLPAAAAFALPLACLALLAACAPEKPAAEPSPSLTVALVAPEAREIVREVVASGAIAAWEEVAVGVELSGLRVSEVAVEVGDRVRAGDVLLRLDARTLRSDLAQAQAAVAQAEANLDVALRKARRARGLADQKLVAAQDAEELEAAAIGARAQRATAVAARDAAQVQLGFATVRAPHDGVISARSVQPGQVAAGAELLRLIRDGRLEWRAEVTEQELARIRPGTAVAVEAPGGGSVAGWVRQVSPALDAARRTGTVYADLSDPGALRAGAFAQGRLVLDRDRGLTIPQEAVLRRDGRAYVFVVDAERRARERRIETGATLGDRIEVRAGLTPAERVVARGAGFLGDGDLVRVVKAGADATATPAATTAVR